MEAEGGRMEVEGGGNGGGGRENGGRGRGMEVEGGGNGGGGEVEGGGILEFHVYIIVHVHSHAGRRVTKADHALVHWILHRNL